MPLLSRTIGKTMNLRKIHNPKHQDFLRRMTLSSQKRFSNLAEEEFRGLCAAKDLKAIHKGLPDFMVFDGRGNFKGFIEVKRKPGEELRFPQKLFRRICRMWNIPYAIWERGGDLPSEFYK